MNKQTNTNIKLYALFVAVFVVMFYGYYTYTRFQNKAIIIDDQLLKTSLSGERSSNLISDTDGTIYKVSNAPLVLHFRSAEVLNTLNNKSGRTFLVSGYGIRVPVLGLYPMITSAVPATKQF